MTDLHHRTHFSTNILYLLYDNIIPFHYGFDFLDAFP
jgi:hypothetical protein